MSKGEIGMTKPTEKTRGTAPAGVEENEEQVVEERISELEAELAALDGPPPPLSLTDIAQGAVALVDKHEGRRGTIEQLLAAYRIKRLEMQRSRYEREQEPFMTAREVAGERLEELEAQRIALMEEIGKARADWGDANVRAESKGQHIQAIDREIRELRGE
jgi:hypothetical protein